MTKYMVKNTSILHNGKVYKEGSDIELTNDQAKRLEDFVELSPNQNTSASSKTKVATKTETKSQTAKAAASKNTASKLKTKTEANPVKSDDSKSSEDDNNDK